MAAFLRCTLPSSLAFCLLLVTFLSLHCMLVGGHICLPGLGGLHASAALDRASAEAAWNDDWLHCPGIGSEAAENQAKAAGDDIHVGSENSSHSDNSLVSSLSPAADSAYSAAAALFRALERRALPANEEPALHKHALLTARAVNICATAAQYACSQQPVKGRRWRAGAAARRSSAGGLPDIDPERRLGEQRCATL